MQIPLDRSDDIEKQSMAQWQSERLREATEVARHPAYREGLGSRSSLAQQTPRH
jgi:hypothetical protein